MEEMTFQDILREKQRMEYKYKGKAYKEYHKLKAWENRIYVICLTVFFIVFFCNSFYRIIVFNEYYSHSFFYYMDVCF